MARRVQKEKVAQDRKQEDAEAQSPPPSDEEAAEAKRKATEELLDEIDEVLEVNAEEFVKSYVQKGGE